MPLELIVRVNEKSHLDWLLCTCCLVCSLDFGSLDQKSDGPHSVSAQFAASEVVYFLLICDVKSKS